MSDVVPGMAPMAPSLPLTSEGRATFVGHICCGKAKFTLFKGRVVTVCPDHEPTYDFKPLRFEEPGSGT